MRRGLEALQVVYIIVILVVSVTLAAAMMPKEQVDPFPSGIAITLSSDKEFVDFVKSPSEGSLILIGEKSITKGFTGKLQDIRDSLPLIGSKQTSDLNHAKITPLNPTAFMYPLAIRGSKAADTTKPFGDVKLGMEIDTSKLEDYFSEQSDGRESFNVGKPETEDEVSKKVNDMISIKICWNSGKKCYKEDDPSFSKSDGIALSKLINSECQKRQETSYTSFRKFGCSFEIDSVIEKCCPSSADIVVNVTANLKDGNGRPFKRIIEWSISPTVMYYMDSLSDREAFFSDFGTLSEEFLEGEGEEKTNPINNTLIYPCRAIVPSKEKLSALSDRITGPGEEKIIFGCEDDSSNPSIKKDQSGYAILDYGWLCKKTGKGYYLLNPYAFCRLRENSLPDSPTPGYFEGARIPSGSKSFYGIANTEEEIAWSVAKEAIDAAYGLTASTGQTDTPPSGTGQQNTDDQADSSTNENPDSSGSPEEQKPEEPVQESWMLTGCEGECSNGYCVAKKLELEVLVTKDTQKTDYSYVCSDEWIERGHLNSICQHEPDTCTPVLKKMGGSEKVNCPCSGP